MDAGDLRKPLLQAEAPTLDDVATASSEAAQEPAFVHPGMARAGGAIAQQAATGAEASVGGAELTGCCRPGFDWFSFWATAWQAYAEQATEREVDRVFSSHYLQHRYPM